MLLITLYIVVGCHSSRQCISIVLYFYCVFFLFCLSASGEKNSSLIWSRCKNWSWKWALAVHDIFQPCAVYSRARRAEMMKRICTKDPRQHRPSCVAAAASVITASMYMHIDVVYSELLCRSIGIYSRIGCMRLFTIRIKGATAIKTPYARLRCFSLTALKINHSKVILECYHGRISVGGQGDIPHSFSRRDALWCVTPAFRG